MIDSERVVLLDGDGTPIGTELKSLVHTAHTPLHLAFSCHVVDDDGAILLSRRALTKRSWPGVWTNAFCGHPRPGEDLLDAVRRHGRDELGLTALAGALIYINWQAFLIGALSDRVVETALGYFINPITTVLLGVFVLGERMRRLQWVAVGIAAVAVIVIVVVYGTVPWIALALTFSFGLYGLIKKKIGPKVDALSGLTLESFWLVPIAVVQLLVVARTTGITFGAHGIAHAPAGKCHHLPVVQIGGHHVQRGGCVFEAALA